MFDILPKKKARYFGKSGTLDCLDFREIKHTDLEKGFGKLRDLEQVSKHCLCVQHGTRILSQVMINVRNGLVRPVRQAPQIFGRQYGIKSSRSVLYFGNQITLNKDHGGIFVER